MKHSKVEKIETQQVFTLDKGEEKTKERSSLTNYEKNRHIRETLKK